VKKILEQGFTTLEILVTIIIASMFIITFFEMFTDIVKSNGTITRHVIADDFAYSKLKKYTASSNNPNIWFVCTTNSDALVNPNANGLVIESGDVPGNEASLPRPAKYEIRAKATYGCQGVNSGKPVLLTIEVTYGEYHEKVYHSVMAEY